MHRRADYTTAAAIRSDERVEGFVTEAREPLTVLRTLGGMLSTHLKPESPSRDMAEAIVAQGDVLAELSSDLVATGREAYCTCTLQVALGFLSQVDIDA